MNYSKDDIIKFNNKEYLIIEIIQNSYNTYLYLINNDEFENDVSIVKVKNKNGLIEYCFIDNEEEFNFVLNSLFLNMKDDILSFLIDE